jgi:hypothetical protein
MGNKKAAHRGVEKGRALFFRGFNNCSFYDTTYFPPLHGREGDPDNEPLNQGEAYALSGYPQATQQQDVSRVWIKKCIRIKNVFL